MTISALPRQPFVPLAVRLRGAAKADLGWRAVAVVLAGVTYNGVLAFLNAHGLHVGYATVATTEILILLAAAGLILSSGPRESDTPAVAMFLFFLVNAVVVSVINGVLFVDMARNAAIMVFFLLLGSRIGEQTLKRCFVIAAGLVAAALLLELVSVPGYTGFFGPSSYFFNTRGIAPATYDDSGLFANALSFEGRFSILKISNHRTASLFLEQVSLANFSAALAIYLCCRWRAVSRRERVFFIALITLILLSNNSRVALTIVLVAPIVYYAAPKLNRYAVAAVMPMVLIVGTTIALIGPYTTDDTLLGRLGFSVRTFGHIDALMLAGARATIAGTTYLDSGYTYIICASSLLGLLAIWLFVSLISPGMTKAQLRCSVLTALYIFANLMVSGTAIFSIKVGALIWLMMGFVRAQGEDEVAAEPRKELKRPSPAGAPKAQANPQRAPAQSWRDWA